MHRPNRPIPVGHAQTAQERSIPDPETGCWNSTYAPTANGYSSIAWREDGVAYGTTVHRASWSYTNGKIPQGMVVDHKCFNRACINPDHLRLLTLRENTRNRLGAHVPPGQCKNGHPDSDLRVVRSGVGKTQRLCSSCLRDRNARTTARLKAERLAAKAAGTASPSSGRES